MSDKDIKRTPVTAPDDEQVVNIKKAPPKKLRVHETKPFHFTVTDRKIEASYTWAFGTFELSLDITRIMNLITE